MAYCNVCGTQTADYAVTCPNCGAPMQQNAGQNVNQNGYQNNSGYNPYGQPYAQPYASPYPQQPAEAPTSALMWFGWLMLCYFLPIIGPIIIMNNSTSDQSTKNYGKCMLILQIVTAAAALFFFIFIFGLLSGFRGY